MTKKKRLKAEQIIAKLREAETMLAAGKSVGEVVQHLEVSEQTYYRWKQRFGGMKSEEVKRLRDLEVENARLKKLVADLNLDKEILKEALEGNY
jgi:transposase